MGSGPIGGDANFLDTGVPWYDTYRTADDQWMAVGALKRSSMMNSPVCLGFPTISLAPRRSFSLAATAGSDRASVRDAHPGRVDSGVRG